MNKLEQKLRKIEADLGSTEPTPEVSDKLGWHLDKIESLIEGGGGGSIPEPVEGDEGKVPAVKNDLSGFEYKEKADLVNGKVPAEELPSYVDDVLEFADEEHFPSTGEEGKIYVALDTGFTYRWSGSEYIQIGGQDLSEFAKKSLISDEYDNTQTYSVGDYCIYNNTLYRCTTAVSVAEDFDSNKWSACKIADVMVDLDSNQTITGTKRIDNNTSFKIGSDSNGISIFNYPVGGILGGIRKTNGSNVLLDFFDGYTRFGQRLEPQSDNAHNIGDQVRRIKDLYIAGKIKDGTNEVSVANIFNGLYGAYATNSTTELKYETINDISISANTTFTLATAPANTYPEYKANITNSGASDITITLPSGTVIKGNVSISSNTFVIPSGSTVEVNIQNDKAIVVEW